MPQLNDIGIQITGSIKRRDPLTNTVVEFDLTPCTTLECILFRHRDGTTLTKDATVIGDATAGVARYTTTASTDLSQQDQYSYWFHLVGAGFNLLTQPKTFLVGTNP